MPSSTINTRQAWILLSAACLLFLAQVLPLLHTRWVEDESWYCIGPYSLLTEGHIRNPTFPPTNTESVVDLRTPGYALLIQPVFRFFGVGPLQARSLPVLAGLGVVLVTFFLGRQLLNASAGVLAAFLVATDMLLWLTARTVRPDVFVAFFGTLGLLLHFIARDRQSIGYQVLAGLGVGAAMNFHPNGVTMAAAIGLLLLIETPRRFWRNPRFWAFGLTVVAAMLPFLIWSHSTPIYTNAFNIMYNRGEYYSFWQKLHGEIFGRYKDYLGFPSRRFQFGLPIPLRLHIVLLLAVSCALLAIRNRRLWLPLAVVVTLTLLWFLYTPSKVVRYLVIPTPIFSVIIAAAVISLADKRRQYLAMLAACCICMASQLGGNLIILTRFRKADYLQVTSQLQQLIPKGETILANITFWMALHDRPYLCYDFEPFQETIKRAQPAYLILNDRVMMNGYGTGNDDLAELRVEANRYAKDHGTLFGHVSNPFYGELDIYHIHY